MKKLRLLSSLMAACLLTGLCFSFPAAAENVEGTADSVVYDIVIEDDSMQNAIKLQETVEKKDGRIITTSVYRLENGEIITDVFEKGDLSKMRSTTGSDTATRTRYVQHGEISMTASFKWAANQVECTNASGSYSLPSTHEKKICSVSRPTSPSSTSVKATMKYHFVDMTNKAHYVDSSFYIKCTTRGAISDNAAF